MCYSVVHIDLISNGQYVLYFVFASQQEELITLSQLIDAHLT